MQAQDAGERVDEARGGGDREPGAEARERATELEGAQAGGGGREGAHGVEARLVVEALVAAEDGADVIGKGVEQRGDAEDREGGAHLGFAREHRGDGDRRARRAASPARAAPDPRERRARRPGDREPGRASSRARAPDRCSARAAAVTVDAKANRPNAACPRTGAAAIVTHRRQPRSSASDRALSDRFESALRSPRPGAIPLQPRSDRTVSCRTVDTVRRRMRPIERQAPFAQILRRRTAAARRSTRWCRRGAR